MGHNSGRGRPGLPTRGRAKRRCPGRQCERAELARAGVHGVSVTRCRVPGAGPSTGTTDAGRVCCGVPPHHCELPESGCEEREEEAPWAAWGRVGTGCLKGSRGRHVGVAKQRSALPWLSREAGVLFSHFTDGEGETRSGARGPCEDGGGGRAEEEGCGHLWEGWQALGSALRPLIWRMRAEVTDV